MKAEPDHTYSVNITDKIRLLKNRFTDHIISHYEQLRRWKRA